MSIQDYDLIKLVQEGDRQAFDILVQKYQLRIMNLVTRYVKDPSEALDITQESFLKAYGSLDKFRGDSAFYTWLYRIAINTAKNHLTVQNKKMTNANFENIDVEQTLYKTQDRDFTPPELLMIRNELETAVLDVIEHLPHELKTAIILREMEGLTYDEIAGVMACPIGTVRSRIFRAREAIEHRIKPMMKKLEH